MLKSIMTAAILSVGVATAAIALPASPGSQPAATSDVIQVKKDWDHKGKWRKNKWSKNDHWKYGKGHHYKNPPPGWNSYAYRPWGWERRGCIVIGRAWFCP